MADEISRDDLTESIKILATDDEKIKSFGELLTNDSSREILQMLFNEDLTATQIAQKSSVSLQLVKYHLNKLQVLGVVQISKIEKNSKSQDMKFYTASKFSIVIVPPKFSAKTKKSKLLIHSFRNIYKIAGLGIATGFSGLLSLTQLQQDKQVPVVDVMHGSGPTMSEPNPESSDVVLSDVPSLPMPSDPFKSDEFRSSVHTSEDTSVSLDRVVYPFTETTTASDSIDTDLPQDDSVDVILVRTPENELSDLDDTPLETAEISTAPEPPMMTQILESEEITDSSFTALDAAMSASDIGASTSELFVPLVVVTSILSGLTAYHLYKFFKKDPINSHLE